MLFRSRPYDRQFHGDVDAPGPLEAVQEIPKAFHILGLLAYHRNDFHRHIEVSFCGEEASLSKMIDTQLVWDCTAGLKANLSGRDSSPAPDTDSLLSETALNMDWLSSQGEQF